MSYKAEARARGPGPNGHGVAAGHVGSRDQGSESYIFGLGPVGLGQQLVLVAALDGAADAVDAVVALAGREALERLLDRVALLLDEVVPPAQATR